MMKGVQYLALLVVAAAAVVLSFTTLRDLALACGYSHGTAWLLPVVIDAGAAAGAIAWLHGAGPARRFGQTLALVLLAASVGGNALGHGLAAYQSVPVSLARPGWLVVVGVSAVAPAVLGAVVHLAMLAGRTTGPSVRGSADRSGPLITEADRAAMEEAAGVPVTVTEPPGEDADDTADEPAPDRGPDRPDRSDDELVALVRAWTDVDGAPPSRESIRRRFGIGSGRADRIRTDALTGPHAPPPA